MPKCENKLDTATIDNTPLFCFGERTVTAKVLKVYDGDTITVAFDTFNIGICAHHVRLLDIDTPEIKSKNPAEREAAGLARNKLSDLVMGKIITLKTKGSDKYGRLLGHIYINGGDCINTKMVECGAARTYSGGHREPWTFAQ